MILRSLPKAFGERRPEGGLGADFLVRCIPR
jgi:hypothetical protein